MAPPTGFEPLTYGLEILCVWRFKLNFFDESKKVLLSPASVLSITLTDPLYDEIIEVEERVTSSGKILKPINIERLINDLRKIKNVKSAQNTAPVHRVKGSPG